MSLAAMPIAGMVLGLPALFALGVASSPHCALMCAPMTQLAQGGHSRHAMASATFLNGGRLSSYAMLGAVAGAVGGGVLLIADHWHAGTVLRLSSAVLLTAMGFGQWCAARPRPACCAADGLAAQRRIHPYFAGLLWGLLPCPLLYAVLGLSVLSGSALQGAFLLLAFGLGTTPLLLGLSALGRFRQRLTSRYVARFAAALLMITGLWIALITLMEHPAASAFCRGLI